MSTSPRRSARSPSASANGSPTAVRVSAVVAGDVMVVVHVCDQVNRTLAGHDGREYTSPPQTPGHALALVALLLGRPTGLDRGDQSAVWRCPVAGGQRTITLTPASASPAAEALS